MPQQTQDLGTTRHAHLSGEIKKTESLPLRHLKSGQRQESTHVYSTRRGEGNYWRPQQGAKSLIYPITQQREGVFYYNRGITSAPHDNPPAQEYTNTGYLRP